MKLLMQTNEHVAGQRGPLFSGPVLVALKTITIFNVNGDFLFLSGASGWISAHQYTVRRAA